MQPATFILRPFQRVADLVWREWGVPPSDIARQMLLAATVFGLFALLIWVAAGNRMFVFDWYEWQKPWLVASVVSMIVLSGAQIAKHVTGHSRLPLSVLLPMYLMSALGAMSFMVEFIIVCLTRLSGAGLPVSAALLAMGIAANLALSITTPRTKSRKSGGATAKRSRHALPYLVLGCLSFLTTVVWFVRSGDLLALLMLVLATTELLAAIFLHLDMPPGLPRHREAVAAAGASA